MKVSSQTSEKFSLEITFFKSYVLSDRLRTVCNDRLNQFHVKIKNLKISKRGPTAKAPFFKNLCAIIFLPVDGNSLVCPLLTIKEA